MTPNFVPQRGAKDCGIACVAMVAGISYEEAHALTGHLITADHGIYTCHMPAILGALGIATRTVFMSAANWHEDLHGIRLADVGGHYVVVDASDNVLDPARGPGQPISNYPKAFHAWEIHRVSTSHT